MDFSNFLIGVCFMALGTFMMVKAFYLNHQIYFVEFAERKWGPGSGTLAYRYMGFALVIFSVFVIIGRINLTNQQGTSNRRQQTPTFQPINEQGFNIAP